jgi:hypothetical protein
MLWVAPKEMTPPFSTETGRAILVNTLKIIVNKAIETSKTTDTRKTSFSMRPY